MKTAFCKIPAESLSAFLHRLKQSELASSRVVWGLGVDAAPFNKGVGICINFVEDEPLTLVVLNQLFDGLLPIRIRPKLVDVRTDSFIAEEVGLRCVEEDSSVFHGFILLPNVKDEPCGGLAR